MPDLLGSFQNRCLQNVNRRDPASCLPGSFFQRDVSTLLLLKGWHVTGDYTNKLPRHAPPATDSRFMFKQNPFILWEWGGGFAGF